MFLKLTLKSLYSFFKLKWLIRLISCLSLIWLLIRVIPKPSRLNYPCIRTTFPFASYFLAWTIGLFSSVLFFRHAKERLRKSNFVVAFFTIIIAVFAAWISVSGLITPLISGKTTPETLAETVSDEINAPIGDAKGTNPGRVVWVHNPDATDWGGPDSGESCWEPENINQLIVDNMLSKIVRWLTGKKTVMEAWDYLFKYTNARRGLEDFGYQNGEKIVIKINLTLSNISGRDNPQDRELKVNLDKTGSTNPQVILSLLRQLVNDVGVNQDDISIGDPVTYFPQQWYDYLVTEFPNVQYLDHYPYIGRKEVTLSTTPIRWSTSDALDKLEDYLPSSYADADYLINIPVLKSHGLAGITLSAKNHFGSLIRSPVGNLWGETKNYYVLHDNLPKILPGSEKYRCLVDLMGHEHIGGKTVLYLVDALFGGQFWNGVPYKWEMHPFNGDWPSSLFASQDPVAIDSVGFDFLSAEWPDTVNSGNGEIGSLGGGAQDYLHEAAQADNPPSGTFYDPEGDGIAMRSIGVHEHWNNSIEKKYSRNLGVGDGIELIDNDIDDDGTGNDFDGCPNDPFKTETGICGCGIADIDSDSDETVDCNDSCPEDPDKILPGICGCGMSDIDSDEDGTVDCLDDCDSSVDTDGDGTGDCDESCPNDPNKTEPGICGCGLAEVDTDNDLVLDCLDNCPNDPDKIEPGTCGCGTTDSDSDGTPDCLDDCDGDPNKVAPGICGCSVPDIDTDGDGTLDCIDNCPTDPNKINPGVCGCGILDTDTDGDGALNCNDGCINDPNKVTPGICGCGVADIDSDNDGTLDCNDQCPNDPDKITEGYCGCGLAETDGDNDGTLDCIDTIPIAIIIAPESDHTISVGESVVFRCTVANGNEPFTYLWDFDGGAENSNQQDPGEVTFSEIGTYNVTLAVTDNDGDTDNDTVIIVVSEAFPIGDDDDDDGGGGNGGNGGCFLESLF